MTYHPEPKVPLQELVGEPDDLKKLPIISTKSRGLICELLKRGIHGASLFPGLDGIAETVENTVYADAMDAFVSQFGPPQYDEPGASGSDGPAGPEA